MAVKRELLKVEVGITWGILNSNNAKDRRAFAQGRRFINPNNHDLDVVSSVHEQFSDDSG